MAIDLQPAKIKVGDTDYPEKHDSAMDIVQAAVNQALIDVDNAVDNVSQNIGDINTVAGIAADVTQVAGDSAAINTVAGIEQEIIAAPAYASQASGSAIAAAQSAERINTLYWLGV